MASQAWSTGLAVLVLALVAAGVGAAARLGNARAVLWASARAVVQLAAVGLVIGVVLRTAALAPLYLAAVLAAAAHTSGRRLPGVPAARRLAAGAIGAGAAVTVAVVFVSGALPWGTATAVPFAVQLMGGAMTATTLAGQRLLDDVGARWAEVEGWLALGATPRQAVADLARRAAGRALVPALDQTRNVGLVVLPGAYVGLLLGGADPWTAGRVQLLTLVGLLATESVAAVVVTRLLAGRLGAVGPETAQG